MIPIFKNMTTPAKPKGRATTNVEIINIIERRLAKSYLSFSFRDLSLTDMKNLEKDPEDKEIIISDEIMSTRSVCLQFLMLGNAYNQLITEFPPVSRHQIEFSSRCMRAYREAAGIATKDLASEDGKMH